MGIEPSTGKDCLFLHSVQSGCKAQSASYPVCTRSSFPEAMVPRREGKLK